MSRHDKIRFTMEEEAHGAFPSLTSMTPVMEMGASAIDFIGDPAIRIHIYAIKTTTTCWRSSLVWGPVCSEWKYDTEFTEGTERLTETARLCNLSSQTHAIRRPPTRTQIVCVFVVSGSAAKKLAGFLRVTRAPTKMRQLITAVEEALEPLVYVNYLVGVEGFTSVRAMDQCSVEHKRCFTLLYPENSASLKHALENKNRLC